MVVRCVVILPILSSLCLVATAETPPNATVRVIDALEKGKQPKLTCFGWSRKTDTFVCHTYEWDHQTGGTYRLEFVGNKPETIEFFTYNPNKESMQFFGDLTQKLKAIDRKALNRVRTRLRRDGFGPMMQRVFPLRRGRTLKVGNVMVRLLGKGEWLNFPARSKSYHTRKIGSVEVRCGRGWRALKLHEPNTQRDYAPTVDFYVLSRARLLMVTTLHWHVHGNSGVETSVSIETAKTLCAKERF